MSKQYTHVLKNYPEVEDEVMVQTPMGPRTQLQKRPSQSILYRASDGMCIGARQATVVSVGPDQKEAVMRTYLDETYATKALRDYADADWAMKNESHPGDSTFAARIEEIDCSDEVAKAKLARPSLVDIAAANRSKQ